MDTSLVLNIQLEGDVGLAKQYIPEARVLAASLANRLKLGGIESGSAKHLVTDEVLIVAVIAMGNASVHITAGHESSSEQVEVERIVVPDFYSGVTARGEIVAGDLMDRFMPTAESGRRHNQEQAWLAAQKLSVLPYIKDTTKLEPTKFSEAPSDHDQTNIDFGSDFTQKFIEESEGFSTQSQYATIKPTFFSGKMRQLVQVLMGFGKNTRYPLKMEEDSGDEFYFSHYERQVRTKGRQIRYDYRWVRTHGITTGNDGSLWLVEVSLARGVLAMPLPLIPVTDTDDFYDKVMEAADTDALALLDEYGGFPSGEAFPAIPAALDLAIESGLILRLAEKDDLHDFYRKAFYSTAIGWAFSKNGDKVSNTCNRHNSDNGQLEGFLYDLNIKIGNFAEVDKPENRSALIKMLKAAQLQFEEERDVLARKIDRLTTAQGEEILKSNSPIDTLKEASITPVSSGSCNMTLGAQGYLWQTPNKEVPSFLKFYEPLSSFAVLSFVMKPDMDTWDKKVRDCDTPVFVFYDGDTQHKCNFFLTTAPMPESSEESNFEECMYIGEWKRTVTSGGGKVMGNFYTSKLDSRQERYVNTTTTIVKGKDLGWASVHWGDDPTDIRRGSIGRDRAFLMTTETEKTEGFGLVNALVIGGWDRESYYYATKETSLSGSRTTGGSIAHLADPNRATYYRTLVPEGTGYFSHPHPVCGDKETARRVWELRKSTGNPCSYIVDKGIWLKECQRIDAMKYSINHQAPENTVERRNWEGKLSVTFYSSTTGEIETIKDAALEITQTPLWFVNSPDEYGNLQWIFATQNSWKPELADYYRIDADLNCAKADIIVEGSPFSDSDEFKGNLTYIGVIT